MQGGCSSGPHRLPPHSATLGGSPGLSRGEQSRRQEGQTELSVCRGAESRRCAGTQPGGNYSSAAMMPRCRNGRGGSPLSLGLPRAARLALGSVSRALSPVLPALVVGPESSPQHGAARDVSPPGSTQGTSALQ